MGISADGALGQQPATYGVLSGNGLGGVQVNLPTPYQFKPGLNVSTPTISRGFQPTEMAGPLAVPGTVPVDASHRYDINPGSDAEQAQRQARKEADAAIDEMNKKDLERYESTRPFREAFVRLCRMNPSQFSLSNAVYEVENAYLDGRLSFDKFGNALAARVNQVRQILKAQGLSRKSNLSLNFAIQQLFEHPNAYRDPKTNLVRTVPALKYDFEDYMGEKDYANVFAVKVLATGSGQCHSLPLIYLMVAEQLGAKAWLSLAPNHSFIQFMDSRGRLLDYETTNGNIVSASWMAGSGYINAKALRHRTYLDTLSSRKLYTRCLGDLLLEYLKKFEYDDLAQQINGAILRLDSLDMTGLIVDANWKRSIAWREIQAAGKPKPEDIPKFPRAFKAYEAFQEAVAKVDNLGYQDMPSDAYQEWLKSIEVEKTRLATEKLKEQVKLQVRLQKSSLQNKKR